MDKMPSKTVDPQREAELAARRLNLARSIRVVPDGNGRYLIAGAPERLRGPYSTSAGAVNAFETMLRYADAFEIAPTGVVQTHEVGKRMGNGSLIPLRQRPKGGRGKAYQRPPEQTLSDEYIQQREDVRIAMVQVAMDGGMKEQRAVQEAETFLFGAEARGEKLESILERWRELRQVASSRDPRSLEGMS